MNVQINIHRHALPVFPLLTGVESRGHSINTQPPAAHFYSSLICDVGCRVMLCIRIPLVYNLQERETIWGGERKPKNPKSWSDPSKQPLWYPSSLVPNIHFLSPDKRGEGWVLLHMGKCVLRSACSSWHCEAFIIITHNNRQLHQPHASFGPVPTHKGSMDLESKNILQRVVFLPSLHFTWYFFFLFFYWLIISLRKSLSQKNRGKYSSNCCIVSKT